MNVHKAGLLHLSYPSVLLCSNFTREDWLWLVAQKDSMLRSYMYQNKHCPTEILQFAVTETAESEAGVLSSAAANVNAPREVVQLALDSSYSPARGAALGRADLDWTEVGKKAQLLTLYEKLVLFGRSDCPEWMLRIMWKLPSQMSLDGKDDINETLRRVAERRLKKGNMLTSEELEEIAAREASK